MTKTEEAIKLLKEDPFQSLQEVAKKCEFSTASSLRSRLKEVGVSVAEMREQALQQLKESVPEDFEYDFDN